MPSEYQIRQAESQQHQQELDALTLRLETVEGERDYLLGENRRLLASLFEEQRQAKKIAQALGVEGLDEILKALATLRAKDAPSCPPAAEVAPEVTTKVKRPRKAKGGGQ